MQTCEKKKRRVKGHLYSSLSTYIMCAFGVVESLKEKKKDRGLEEQHQKLRAGTSKPSIKAAINYHTFEMGWSLLKKTHLAKKQQKTSQLFIDSEKKRPSHVVWKRYIHTTFSPCPPRLQFPDPALTSYYFH